MYNSKPEKRKTTWQSSYSVGVLLINNLQDDFGISWDDEEPLEVEFNEENKLTKKKNNGI